MGKWEKLIIFFTIVIGLFFFGTGFWKGSEILMDKTTCPPWTPILSMIAGAIMIIVACALGSTESEQNPKNNTIK